MSIGDDAPLSTPVDLGKRPSARPEPVRSGPSWIVVPVRVVALVVLVPLRIIHDLAVLSGRGARAVWNGLLRAPVWLGRRVGRLLGRIGLALYRWLLAPLGRLLGAVLDLLVVRPLRWLAAVVVLGSLRWIHRVLIAPVGRFLALAGRGVAWLLTVILITPLRVLGRGLAWLLSLTGRALGLLAAVLVVMPLVFLWRYVLRPPLLVLAWLGRGTLSVLGALGGLLASAWRGFAAGVVWSWRLIGRCLAWLARTLVVLPARTVWRYILAPIAAGVAGTWRLTARVLRWFWHAFVVVPVRVLVVSPLRWVRTSVLRPIAHGVRETWRVSVREPVRAARQAMRDAGRDVRLHLRRAFRGH